MIPLVEKYRPLTLGGFAGLDAPRAILAKLAAEPYSSAWLLIGPSGSGKTTMGMALADMIGAELHHIPSRKCDLEAVDRIVHACHYVPLSGKRFHLVLIDEADQMSKAAQHAFLSRLDGTAPVPDTIFIFTANASNLLEDRLLSRLRIVPFETEATPALALLKRIWALESTRPAPDLAELLRKSNMNIRSALMALEVDLIGSITPEPAARAIEAAPRLRCDARSTKRGVDARLPPVGTVLARTFRERRIKVEVLADGFRFERRRYTSLSAIAKEVAQGNRNGFEFFGLRGA